MQPGYTTPPGYGAPPPPNDKTTLYGVLGIIGAFCCWPLGAVFAVLCLLEAKKSGKQPTLAYVSFGLLGLFFIIDIIVIFTGGISSLTGR
jgi:predicted membrane channel-forming protein YqfA (hemolysin III family)